MRVEDQKIRRNIEGHLAIQFRKTPYDTLYPEDNRTGISPEPLGKAVNLDFNYISPRKVLGVAQNLRI